MLLCHPKCLDGKAKLVPDKLLKTRHFFPRMQAGEVVEMRDGTAAQFLISNGVFYKNICF
jgi:hypothetical protein